MTAIKQPKRRVFEKKLRGRKAFARDNAGLITNLTGYHGKAKDVPDAAIELAKGTVTGLAAIRAASKAGAKRTKWATLKGFVMAFDGIHNTKIWETFELWMKKYPEFSKLQQHSKVAKAVKVIEKMIAYQAAQVGIAPSAKRFDSFNGTDLTAQIASITDYQELIVKIRQAASNQVAVNLSESKANHTHYDYGMR